MLVTFLRLYEEEAAQGTVEYALLLMLVALAVMSGLNLFRQGLEVMYGRITDALP